MLGFDSRLLRSERYAERRVLNHVVELVAGELVVVVGVAASHVVGVLAADKRRGLGDGEGERVELLPEGLHIRIRVECEQPLAHAAEHLRGAHGAVVHEPADVVALEHARVGGDDEVGHEIDDVAAGEVLSGLVGLGEAAHEVLEDAAHLDLGHFTGAEVALAAAEVLYDLVQHSAVRHRADLVIELHAGLEEDVLHVLGKALEIVCEVLFYACWVGKQGLPREGGRVVEVVARGAAQESVAYVELCSPVGGLEHLLVRGQQAVVEALHDGHGQDYASVLDGLV